MMTEVAVFPGWSAWCASCVILKIWTFNWLLNFRAHSCFSLGGRARPTLLLSGGLAKLVLSKPSPGARSRPGSHAAWMPILDSPALQVCGPRRRPRGLILCPPRDTRRTEAEKSHCVALGMAASEGHRHPGLGDAFGIKQTENSS